MGVGEGVETQTELGCSVVVGRSHSTKGEVEDYLELVKERVVEMRMDSPLWHFLWLKDEVAAYPTAHLHMEPLQQLPGPPQQPHCEQETETAVKGVLDLEGLVWHLWEMAEN